MGSEITPANIDTRTMTRSEAEMQFTARERAMIRKLEMIATGRTGCGGDSGLDLELARDLATEALAEVGWPCVRKRASRPQEAERG